MSKLWLDQKIWEECKKAEAWWAERMPELKSISDKRIEQWREEKEHKDRWRYMIV
jgi:hypothetical protein